MQTIGFIGVSGLFQAMAKTLNGDLASALGHGSKYVPSLVEAQEQLTRTHIVAR